MKVKAATLVLDMNLYPRHNMDQQCIADYVEALRAGAEFPPAVFENSITMRSSGSFGIGVHAFMRHLGAEGAACRR